MANYILFETGSKDGEGILVEIDEEELIPSQEGIVKVGIKDSMQNKVAVAQSTFSAAIKNAVHQNIRGLIDSIQSLPDPPAEIEINFGIKMTGEAGNVAVGKIGGEVNYSVKLSWKPSSHITS